MGLRITVSVQIILILVAAHLAVAQQSLRTARVGFVLSSKQTTVDSPTVVAFRQGLAELGWFEGQNIVIEYRFARGVRERYAALITDLVRQHVDVIVATGGGSVRVAKEITKTIPIVMTNASDPVATGFVASLARPGGNITGVASLARNLGGKRLELLKDSIPGISHVAFLREPARPQIEFDQTERAAKELGVKLQTVEVRTPRDLPGIFQGLSQNNDSGVMVTASPLFNSHRGEIAELAAQHGLPAIYPDRRYTRDGGLMSYGPNIPRMFQRAASYVDKILRGAKPADLPVEQAMELELVVNLKAARQIGLTIPLDLLMWAGEVIQ